MTAAAEDMKGRKNLGRGLAMLYGDEPAETPAVERPQGGKAVPVEFLRPGKFQPRRVFDEAELASLADSIKEKGVIQPILVRRDADRADSYEIIAGERRWRAAQLARLHEVPVIVRELSDRDALEIALIENLQRTDLNAIEEAQAYMRLMEEFKHTQEDLARSLGKSRSHVANMLRLLGLPDPVKTMIEGGKLLPGHARALINARNPAALAAEAYAQGLSVRDVERRVQMEREAEGHAGVRRERPPKAASHKDANTLALERDLSNLLGLKVSVMIAGAGGELRISYRTLDQLDDVLRRLKKQAGPLDN
jgi:ParB family transcriptional regulator, chromosome partitioning protein